MKFRTFRAKVRDSARLRQELTDDNATPSGEVELVVAVFGVPDTNVAVGNTRRQIIDKGAFRSWLADQDFENDPPLGFIDHGGAVETGSHSARLMIGYASSGEETDEGLVLRTHYNLDKTVAREAYSDLLHNPAGVQFSFGWDPDKEKTEVRGGEEHVTQLWLTEWSQVAFGAQRSAHLVSARAKASALGGESLEQLPNQVRHAWWDQLETLARALEGFAWVEEVFASDAKRTEGFVVAMIEGGRFAQIPWAILNDGDIAFDTSRAQELEQEWVATGKALTGDEAERMAALGSRSPKTLEDASAQARAVVELAESDPVAEFYKTRLDIIGR